MKLSPSILLRRHAFTVVELVMVLVILGAMSAVALPRYSQSLTRYRVSLAARRVATDLNLARTQARTMGATRTVVFNTAQQSYQLTGEADLEKAGQTYTVLLADDPYRVGIKTLAVGGGSTISFNGYGIPASAAMIVLQAGAYTQTVSLDAGSGRVTVQ